MSSVQLYAIEIPFMCSNASQRVVTSSFFSDSQVTRPALKIVDSQATILVGPNAISTSTTWRSSGTSTGPGAYFLVLTQSECSAQGVPGYITLYTSNLTIGSNLITIRFPRVDSYDTTRMGLVALPNAAAEAAGGLLTLGTGTGQITPSGGSVGIVPGTLSGVSVEVKASGIVVGSIAKGNYSGVSQEVLTGGIQTTSVGKGAYSGVSLEVTTGGIQVASVGKGSYSGVTVGIDNIKAASYSGVSVEASNIKPGTYSGVTVGIDNIKGATYSDVTVQGLSNYANISNVTLAAGTHSNVTIKGIQNYANISSVTLNAGTHSAATIQGLSNYANISNVTLAAGTHSDVTIKGIQNYANISSVTLNAGTHSGATIQGVSNYANFPTLVELTTSSITSMAIAVVDRTIDNLGFGGRTVGSSLAAIRNRVVVDTGAGTITVYDTDDSTILWSGNVTAGGDPLSSVDPT